MCVIIYLPVLNSITLGFFSNITLSQFLVALLFCVGSLSDFLDGYLARKLNQVTTFGKFLDPIADKVLVMLALIYLLVLNPSLSPLYVVMIVVLREFMVTAVRLIVVEKGVVISASIYGKIKTVLQMLALIFLLFNDFGISYFYVSNFITLSIGSILLLISTLAVILSGVDYIYKARQYIFESI
jgi:CDP-diacylglycerol--glycerol-3-phosphate 3-phosphatidyltransferase